MTFEIRPLETADVPTVLPFLRAHHPYRVLTGEAVRWRMEHPTPHATDVPLVAVDADGRIGGFVRSLLTRPRGRDPHGLTFLTTVAEHHRGGGLASLLLTASEKALVERGARTLRTEAADEAVQAGGPALRELALAHGYEAEDTHHILGLDLSLLPPAPEPPAGVELRPFSDYADDPGTVYELDRSASADEPGAAPGVGFMSLEDWIAGPWEHPLSDPDLSLVFLHEGTPAGITCYASDRRTRMESSMTGTLREFRGRGLAGYAKHTALLRARERGFTHATTGNHENNAPMLAINTRLGYSLLGRETGYVKPVG
ncbi:L-amino acid N-acyltransferase YncA [Nocardiopsis flavescens]|uniref:L-amino acid N-acyltransferase YncA n=1 Tax=Nocardiopsis flavescens TaxID=758803 RepID=A0A1M6Q7X4_9ACTN|nr:GNAT family N-acetyltransferase [Nocardiopsis flavescens]SHK16250.1 L-amino acid N-acyltransferase YncA [Nocardiopsis flavescens]